MRFSRRFLTALAIAAICAGATSGCTSDEAAPSIDTGVADGGSNPNDDGGGSPGDDASATSDANGMNDGGGLPGTDGGVADAGSPVRDQCNPVEQTGCMAPTTKCVVENPTPMGGTTCNEPGNDALLGAACTGGDCVAGLACVRTSTGASVCQKVCDFGTGAGCEMLGNEFECRTRLTGTNWGVCSHLPPVCDIFTQMPCEMDQGCGPYLRRAGNYEFRCRSAGTQTEGQTCGSSGGGDCMRGLVCIRSSMTGQAVCRKYCQTNNDCTMPLMCNGNVVEPPFQFCQ